jgi:hypothetical protein
VVIFVNPSRKQYRQGDVLLVEIDQPSRTGKPINPENGRITLARGELSGHAHAIQEGDGKAKLFEGAGDRRYLLMTEIGRLEHEEHGAIVLEPGWYEVRRQREYDPMGTVSIGD